MQALLECFLLCRHAWPGVLESLGQLLSCRACLGRGLPGKSSFLAARARLPMRADAEEALLAAQTCPGECAGALEALSAVQARLEERSAIVSAVVDAQACLGVYTEGAVARLPCLGMPGRVDQARE